jgi:RNA polymerase sigma-70 factor (ECF subfamily)
VGRQLGSPHLGQRRADQPFALPIVIMSERDDSRLVSASLAGDTGAFAELVEKYQKPLYNTALRIIGNCEDAQDITQNTFLKAYDKLGDYRREHQFFSWIYRILINESLNLRKVTGRYEPLSEHLATSNPGPDQEHDAQVLSERIEMCLRQLPYDSRMVIVLRHFNDFTYDEMSALLSIPTKTVKSRLFTARRALADILKRHGVRYGNP